MHLRMGLCAFAAALIALAHGSTASAKIVTVRFETVITSNYYSGVAPLGSSVVGSFTYDTDLAPYQTSPQDGANYRGIFSFEAIVNGVHYQAPKLDFWVTNDHYSGDYFTVTTSSPAQAGPNGPFMMGFLWLDQTGTALNGTELPDVFPAFTGDDTSFFIWEIESNRQSYAHPVWSPVPEPKTWAMLILGFALAGGAVRRRNCSALLAKD
ncbi:MAG: hypothetical protein K0Q62_1435 [Phenylobacterium sp.]|nr:hypothetical protein [Phenylobacterium sp.]